MKLMQRILFIMLLTGCAAQISAEPRQQMITDFESCVAAGNKVMRSYPAKCAAPGVGIFVQQLPDNKPKLADPLRYKKICRDLCGNSECEEMVCQAEGCPCAENVDSCPADCKAR